MIEANDKQSFVVSGSRDEALFVEQFGKELCLMINPAKSLGSDQFAPDLLNYKYSIYADLKHQKTSFNTALVYGVEPIQCVTLNVHDLVRYSVRYSSRFLIYFWLDHPENKNNGIYVANIKRIFDCIERFRRGIIKYQTRDGADGNKCLSYVLDIADFTKLIDTRITLPE